MKYQQHKHSTCVVVSFTLHVNVNGNKPIQHDSHPLSLG